MYATVTDDWATRHWWGSLTPRQRGIWCILQSQLTGPQDTHVGVLPSADMQSVYSTVTDGWATRLSCQSLTPLQRCIWCILRPRVVSRRELFIYMILKCFFSCFLASFFVSVQFEKSLPIKPRSYIKITLNPKTPEAISIKNKRSNINKITFNTGTNMQNIFFNHCAN